jgi:hypothetical protein
MARPTKEQLLEKKRAIEAQLKQMDARDNAKARKIEAHKKIVAGAIALEHGNHDAAFKAQFDALLDRFVERDDDRALFGLLPRAKAPAGVVPIAQSEAASVTASIEASEAVAA